MTVVHESTDPAFVLALLADATEPGADPWLQGQRNHLLRTLVFGCKRLLSERMLQKHKLTADRMIALYLELETATVPMAWA